MEYLKKYKRFVEDAYANASNVSGMGAVVSPQPSTLPGSTTAADATTGSGDVSFYLTDTKKKRKKGNPSEVSDLRDLKNAKVNRIDDLKGKKND